MAFESENVLGNYKCYSALAVQGDNPMADTWWNGGTTGSTKHLRCVVPYYASNMAGGGANGLLS